MPHGASLRAPARNDSWHVLECPARSPAAHIFGYARPVASRNYPQGSSLAAEQRTQPQWQRRWSNARESPVGPRTEQIVGTLVNCYSLQAFGSEAPRGPRSLRPPNRSEMRGRGRCIRCSLAACRWVADGQPAVTPIQAGEPRALFRTNARCRTSAHVTRTGLIDGQTMQPPIWSESDPYRIFTQGAELQPSRHCKCAGSLLLSAVSTIVQRWSNSGETVLARTQFVD
jgi:hypothetical protein